MFVVSICRTDEVHYNLGRIFWKSDNLLTVFCMTLSVKKQKQTSLTEQAKGGNIICLGLRGQLVD